MAAPPPLHDVAHCQRCGGAMEARQAFGQQRPVCVACGFVHFRNAGSAAVAVVMHQRRVLLIRRGIRPYKGAWGFPGGFQDYGEALDETARREAREEAGVEIETGRVLFVGLTRDDPRKLVNVVVFLARPRSADANVAVATTAADDAADARWFGFDELPDQIAFENNQIVLRRLRRAYPDGDVCWRTDPGDED